MEYVQFGKTGRTVSRLGFGGAVAGLKNYLHDYDPADEGQRGQVVAAVEKAIELGVTYFDTAPGYGAGLSESIFGDGFRGADFSKLFIATKVSSRFEKGEGIRSIENSLKRLGAPALDLVQLHGSSYSAEHADFVLREGGMIDELEDAKRQGLIKHIGFTTEDNNDSVYRFIRSGRFDMYQLCYNLFFQHPYDPNRPFGSLFEAEKQGMGISSMRPTTSGLFSKWMHMVDPGNKRDYTQDLIRFCFSNPLIDVVLVGMRNAGRVIANVALCDDIGSRIDIMDLFRYYT